MTSFLHQKAYVHEVLLYALVPYPYQIFASVLGWFGGDREPDLLAYSPEPGVCCRYCRLCLLLDNIYRHPAQGVLICNLCGCADLPRTCCGGSSMSLNPGIVPLLSFPQAEVSRLILGSDVSIE